MSVLIQPVAAARCSGVIHTADARTGDPWVFVLQASRRKAWMPVNFVTERKSRAKYIPPFFRDFSGLEMWICHQPKDAPFVGVEGGELIYVNGYSYAVEGRVRTFPEFFPDTAAFEPRLDAHEPRYRSRSENLGKEPEEIGRLAAESIRKTRTAAKLPGFLDSISSDDILVLTRGFVNPHAQWHSLPTVVKGVLSKGQPSHPLVQVARECGVPMIAEMGGDLGAMPEGSRIRVDSASGEAVLLDQSSDRNW